MDEGCPQPARAFHRFKVLSYPTINHNQVLRKLGERLIIHYVPLNQNPKPTSILVISSSKTQIWDTP